MWFFASQAESAEHLRRTPIKVHTIQAQAARGTAIRKPLSCISFLFVLLAWTVSIEKINGITRCPLRTFAVCASAASLSALSPLKYQLQQSSGCDRKNDSFQAGNSQCNFMQFLPSAPSLPARSAIQQHPATTFESIARFGTYRLIFNRCN